MNYRNTLRVPKSDNIKAKSRTIAKELEKLKEKEIKRHLNPDSRELLLLDLDEIKGKFTFLVNNIGKLSTDSLEDDYGYESFDEWYSDALENLQDLGEKEVQNSKGEVEKFLSIQC